jgi:hypothetical protein
MVMAVLAFALAGCGPSEPRKPPDDAIAHAHKLCILIDGTNLVSQPCRVASGESAVEATIDMTPHDAKKTCTSIAEIAKTGGLKFDLGWKLRIYSPYSGDRTIAYCSLA